MSTPYEPGEALIYKFIDWERSQSGNAYMDEPCTFVRWAKPDVPIVMMRGRENWIYDTRKLRRVGEPDHFNPRGVPQSNIEYPKPEPAKVYPSKPVIDPKDLSLDALGL